MARPKDAAYKTHARIRKALQQGDKNLKQLSEATRINRSRLLKRLKYLRRLGLVSRYLPPRRYRKKSEVRYALNPENTQSDLWRRITERPTRKERRANPKLYSSLQNLESIPTFWEKIKGIVEAQAQEVVEEKVDIPSSDAPANIAPLNVLSAAVNGRVCNQCLENGRTSWMITDQTTGETVCPKCGLTKRHLDLGRNRTNCPSVTEKFRQKCRSSKVRWK